MPTERYANNPVTTLTVACAVSDTTITVASAVGFPTQGNFRVVIDTEIMLVTAVSGNVFTVARGIEGTTAAAHTINTPVGQVLTAASHSASSSLPCEGRLTLTSGIPLNPNDVTGTAAQILYFDPFVGNRIALYDVAATSEWRIFTFGEVSYSLSALVSGAVYDVFAYNSAGVVALETAAWTGANMRNTTIGLTYRDGIPLRGDDATRRYLGTIAMIAAGQGEDSAVNRLVWNYYNRRVRPLRYVDPSGAWTYATAVWRQANANPNAKVTAVLGMQEDTVRVFYKTALSPSSGGTSAYGGIGRNSTSVLSAAYATVGQAGAISAGQYSLILSCCYDNGYLLGRNYWAALENCQGNVSMTFQMAGGPVPASTMGLAGEVLA